MKEEEYYCIAVNDPSLSDSLPSVVIGTVYTMDKHGNITDSRLVHHSYSVDGGGFKRLDHTYKEEVAKKAQPRQQDLFDSYTIEQIEDAAIKIVGEDEVRDIIEELRKTDKDYKPKVAKSLYNIKVEYNIHGIPKYARNIDNKVSPKSETIGRIYNTELAPSWVEGWSAKNYWGGYYKIYYMPATEEEFMRQEMNKTKEHV